MKILNFAFLIFPFCFVSTQILTAQTGKTEDLFYEIMRADSLLFQEAFNTCNIALLYQSIDPEIEFYHDQSGVTFGQENFIEGIRKNICSLPYKPFRRLIEHTNKIYPLKSDGEVYGVIQSGTQEFYVIEKDKSPYLTTISQFTHLWVKHDNDWMLKRVLSFDHQCVPTMENLI